MGLDATAVKRDSMRIVHDLAATPPGFKHTEAGLVPEEWTPKAIVDFAPLQRGYDLPSTQLRPGPVPVVYSNGVLQTHERAMAKGPGVVTGRSGTIGKVHFVEDDYWPHNTALWVTSFLGNDPRFVYYLYSYIDFARFLSGSGVPTLNRSDVHNFVIACPPLPEQRAIAEALSDVDGLLAAQDALIAKKRDIKQAAMQQLLSGMTRLKGFTSEWATVRLGDLGQTYGGLAGKSKTDFNTGIARYVTFLNVLENVVLDPKAHRRVSVLPTERQNRVLKDDVLFNGTSETPGDLAMAAVVGNIEENLYLNSFCFGFRLADTRKCLPLYLAYYFRGSPGRQIMSALAQGATRYNMSKGQFLKLRIRVPEPKEQTEIVAVLADMDAEIAALETERNKIRMIKQGMMQELLTGRVRLVQPEAAA